MDFKLNLFLLFCFPVGYVLQMGDIMGIAFKSSNLKSSIHSLVDGWFHGSVKSSNSSLIDGWVMGQPRVQILSLQMGGFLGLSKVPIFPCRWVVSWVCQEF